MARFRCNTCQGTYADESPGGVRYFHACPPIPNPDLQPDPALPGFDPREQVERTDKRDENVIDLEGRDKGRPQRPGRGRTQLPPVVPGPP